MSNAIDVNNRISLIADELEARVPSARIKEKYIKSWGVTERTMQRYFAFAGDELDKRQTNIEAMMEAQRGALIEEKIEVLRSNFELEAMLIASIEKELESEKVTEGPNGTTIVKTKVSLGEKRRITELIWKKRGILNRTRIKEGENSIMPPVLVVNSPEHKALIDRIAALP